MKPLYYFFLLFAYPILPMENTGQFCPRVLQEMKSAIKSMINKGEIDATQPTNNGCLKIYKKMAEEITAKGDDAFAHNDPKAAELLKGFRKAVIESYPEYAQHLEVSRQKNDKMTWTAFRAKTMIKCIEFLQKKGFTFPNDTFKVFFDINAQLDPEKDYTLVKAGVLLMYTPMQIQASITDVPF